MLGIALPGGAKPPTADITPMKAALHAVAASLGRQESTFKAFEYFGVGASGAGAVMQQFSDAQKRNGWSVTAIESKDLANEPALYELTKDNRMVMAGFVLDGSDLILAAESMGSPPEGWVTAPNNSPPKFDALTREPNMIKGLVLRADGSPLPQGTARLNGMVHGALGVLQMGTPTLTDDTYINVPVQNGRYSKSLVPGFYDCVGKTPIEYGGASGTLDLTPVPDPDAKFVNGHQDSRTGIIQNFYGKINIGTVLIYDSVPIRDHVVYPAGSALVITFTPAGPLLDGSTTQPLVWRHPFATDTTVCANIKVEGVPLGNYDLSIALDGPQGKRDINLYEPPNIKSTTVPLKPDVNMFGSWEGEQYGITMYPEP